MTPEGGAPVHHGNQPDPEAAQPKRDPAPAVVSTTVNYNRQQDSYTTSNGADKNGIMWCVVVWEQEKNCSAR